MPARLPVRAVSARRRLPRAALLLAGLLTAALLPSPAQAQSAARKCARGLAGMTTGFLEIPGHMYSEWNSRGPAWGLTLGFAKGLGAVVTRELVGVYEFVTAPFPVPEGFRPVIQPEFPWDHFEDVPRAAPARPAKR